MAGSGTGYDKRFASTKVALNLMPNDFRAGLFLDYAVGCGHANGTPMDFGSLRNTSLHPKGGLRAARSPYGDTAARLWLPSPAARLSAYTQQLGALSHKFAARWKGWKALGRRGEITALVDHLENLTDEASSNKNGHDKTKHSGSLRYKFGIDGAAFTEREPRLQVASPPKETHKLHVERTAIVKTGRHQFLDPSDSGGINYFWPSRLKALPPAISAQGTSKFKVRRYSTQTMFIEDDIWQRVDVRKWRPQPQPAYTRDATLVHWSVHGREPKHRKQVPAFTLTPSHRRRVGGGGPSVMAGPRGERVAVHKESPAMAGSGTISHLLPTRLSPQTSEGRGPSAMAGPRGERVAVHKESPVVAGSGTTSHLLRTRGRHGPRPRKCGADELQFCLARLATCRMHGDMNCKPCVYSAPGRRVALLYWHWPRLGSKMFAIHLLFPPLLTISQPRDEAPTLTPKAGCNPHRVVMAGEGDLPPPPQSCWVSSSSSPYECVYAVTGCFGRQQACLLLKTFAAQALDGRRLVKSITTFLPAINPGGDCAKWNGAHAGLHESKRLAPPSKTKHNLKLQADPLSMGTCLDAVALRRIQGAAYSQRMFPGQDDLRAETSRATLWSWSGPTKPAMLH
ncbi:hypothetical protein C8R43DRAFT_950829 [Mycena crocata]|nr:hypothetical protein C8R43DRAFT_950829 [Mycena crocata]